jgi:hypothetical protein
MSEYLCANLDYLLMLQIEAVVSQFSNEANALANLVA